jgi:predicted SAM-dependent methyltransferase
MRSILLFLDRIYMALAGLILSPRNCRLVQFDLIRTWMRIYSFGRRNRTPKIDRMHLGSGGRQVPDWLNVDLAGADVNCDVGNGRLPWKDEVFSAIVSQHMIEHLELDAQCIPLFKELYRVLKPQGEIWLSCPDIGKICSAYVDGELEAILESRLTRWSTYSLEGKPISQLVNDMFHQSGQHKNLFDFPLLQWALNQAGFDDVEHVCEADLLERFPNFPKRNDDDQSIYVRVRKGKLNEDHLPEKSSAEDSPKVEQAKATES